jgi:hypothetical protein
MDSAEYAKSAKKKPEKSDSKSRKILKQSRKIPKNLEKS